MDDCPKRIQLIGFTHDFNCQISRDCSASLSMLASSREVTSFSLPPNMRSSPGLSSASEMEAGRKNRLRKTRQGA